MDVRKDTFVVFSDIVESVRLFEVHAQAAADAWDDMLAFLEDPEFALHHKLHKVSGDGLILAAETGDHAVRIAMEINDRLSKARIGPEGTPISTRTGVSVGELIVGTRDVYGNALNLAARLADTALPGEILLTEQVRRSLSADFDRRLKDCGERFLRNVANPVRVHALRESEAESLPLMIPDSALKPLVAVMPFLQVGGNDENYPLGQAFADAIITELSTVRGFSVLSRMSTSRVSAASTKALDGARQHLKAHYLVSGHCAREGDKMTARVELCEVESGLVLWSQRVNGSVFDMLDGSGPTLAVVEQVVGQVLRHEHERSRNRPLASVENYTLLVAGVSMMHGLSREDFAHARELLETLATRASRQSTPLTWLAKWHVMHVLQGLSEDTGAATSKAMELTRRALDADPDNALAHAVEGFARTHLLHEFDEGNDCYSRALQANPSEPLAWLMRGTLRTFTGDGPGAVADTEEAMRLSPADPHRYFFLALMAGAHLCAGNNEYAIALADESLRANRRHLSTLRVKLTAEWRLGRHAAARETTQELLRIDPGFRLSNYLATAAAARFEIGKEVAQALKDSGAPA
jgi:adenylate cyclase